MIQTNVFTLNKEDYLKIIIKINIRRYRFLFIATTAVMASIGVFTGEYEGFWVCWSIMWMSGVALAFYVYFRRYVNAPDNAGLYLRRYHKFDQEFMHLWAEDGSSGSMKLTSITRVEKFPKYYVLYPVRDIFYYIPFDAFQSSEDRQQFEAILRQHNLL